MHLEQAAAALVKSGEYRLLRKFCPVAQYHELPDSSPLALLLDCETTGLDPERDQIIELSFILFQFDPVTGWVGRIVDSYEGLEDPGFPLSEDIGGMPG